MDLEYKLSLMLNTCEILRKKTRQRKLIFIKQNFIASLPTKHLFLKANRKKKEKEKKTNNFDLPSLYRIDLDYHKAWTVQQIGLVRK